MNYCRTGIQNIFDLEQFIVGRRNSTWTAVAANAKKAWRVAEILQPLWLSGGMGKKSNGSSTRATTCWLASSGENAANETGFP